MNILSSFTNSQDEEAARMIRHDDVTGTQTCVLDGMPTTIASVVAVARDGARVTLDAGARERVARGRALIERIVAHGDTVYGVNTGFGNLARVRVSPEQLLDLQRNLVRSHAAGVGEPLPADLTRAMLLIAAASLARGYSGVRP